MPHFAALFFSTFKESEKAVFTTLVLLGAAVLLVAIIFFGRRMIGGFFGLYCIVPANESHVMIKHNKKYIFSSRENKSSYWKWPFITKVHRLPLCNLTIPVHDIKLNDINMARFVCDIACFVNISDVNLAVERLILTDTKKDMGFDMVRLGEDLRAIMESIGRTVTTKQTILDIYMDRGLLDSAITQEVKGVFPKWGIELVDLELKDIKDAPNSTIISDIESKNAAQIRRDAEIKVAQMKQEAEIAKAESEEQYRKRQILRDENVALAEQEKERKVAEARAKANATDVAAKRVAVIGAAEIAKETVEQEAHAQRIKFTTEAEGQANKIKAEGDAHAHVVKVTKEAEAEGNAALVKNVGTAEADVILAKKTAEADGTLKLAEALKKFDKTAIEVKMLDVMQAIQTGKFTALAEALSKADIKLILQGSEAGKFFGINLDAGTGANLEQFLRESGAGTLLGAIAQGIVKKDKPEE